MGTIALTVVAPLLGFLFLATLRDRLDEKSAALIGVGSMAVAFLAFIWTAFSFWQSDASYATVAFWTWIAVGDFQPKFAFLLDGLSLTMTGIIAGVGFLIHLFASWYMQGEEGFARFFSYLNLFVASMLVLVLADNLLLLYLGWEGVGICSYLLIGFYYKNRANGRAAMKAFTVTRVGDVFLAIGLFLLYFAFGTLQIGEINARAASEFATNDAFLALATAMLVGGAWGKSAQIPLHTWLADAMAGPTPVSALIHAATMVTAGVYLIARMHPLFVLTPEILLYWVGVVGAFSMLVASFCALAQSDIKRVLAYSTMSQLGYMFMALGVGAWQAAVFHLMTHAFFKALLFLAAGAVIVSVHHEQNIFKMGGLRTKIPLVFWAFVAGGGALVALPFVTVGFYSKEAILWEAYASGHKALFWAGVFGAFLTAVYTFRLIWLVFFGQAKTRATALRGISYALPLGVLLLLSTALGALMPLPLEGVLPSGAGALLEQAGEATGKHFAEIVSVLAAAAGLLLAYGLYVVDGGKRLDRFCQSRVGGSLQALCYNGLGFDALYDALFVKPFLLLARLAKSDFVDKIWYVFPKIVHLGNKGLSKTQDGLLRTQALGFGLGLAFMLILAMKMVV